MKTIRAFQQDRIPKPRAMEPFPLQEGCLEIEIGCGSGLFARERTKALPDLRLVAIEHTRTRFHAFREALKREGQPSGLYPVHANAIGWIVHSLPPKPCVDRFWILYPNPNPKNRAARWACMPFFEALTTRLKPQGEIVIATNIATYADEAFCSMKENWGLRTTMQSFSGRAPDGSPGRTLFEQKYLARGQTCWEVVGATGIEPVTPAV